MPEKKKRDQEEHQKLPSPSPLPRNPSISSSRRRRRHLIAAMASPLFSLLVCLLLLISPSEAIRIFPRQRGADALVLPRFAEAPEYRNGEGCPPSQLRGCITACDPSHVHIAMTLDLAYLRGTVAAVHSILKHASCPDSVFFHFVSASTLGGESPSAGDFYRLLRSSFPSLRFKIYPFREDLVGDLISPSIRDALENPLNYARNHLADILEPCVDRVIYLDSDLIVVDDIRKLWEQTKGSDAVIAAPEYCHANFTKYFTEAFWREEAYARVFEGRRNPSRCYFNTGVMVMDLARWREGDYGRRIRGWMEVQRRGRPRIYELGSLPPFLLVFAGDVEGVDHRWNQHGLGGHNVRGSCRPLHPGPVSLMHWSGKGKPWVRLDAGNPCPIDHVWAPYNLYLSPPPTTTIPPSSAASTRYDSEASAL